MSTPGCAPSRANGTYSISCRTLACTLRPRAQSRTFRLCGRWSRSHKSRHPQHRMSHPSQPSRMRSHPSIAPLWSGITRSFRRICCVERKCNLRSTISGLAEHTSTPPTVSRAAFEGGEAQRQHFPDLSWSSRRLTARRGVLP